MNLIDSRLLLIGLALVGGSVPTGTARADKPNILLLLADDLGWTGLGCCGSDFYETPNLDALAQRGVRFTSAYSAGTVCSPTRASIMTGKSPARLRLTDYIPGQHRPHARLRIPDWTKRLAPEETTLAERLKAAGYRTGHVGKWHLRGVGEQAAGTSPIDQGFDESFERPEGSRGYQLRRPSVGESGSAYLTDLLTDKACEFIDRSRDGPFFLYLAYNVPHTPIQGRSDLVDHFRKKVDPDAIHTNPTYAAMVASLDQSVGRLIERLDRHDLAGDTVVLFASDNGGLSHKYSKPTGFTDNAPLRRGKGSAYEGGVRVPMIASWPGIAPAGAVCEEPVITTDLFSTLIDAAGLEADPDETLDGRSLTPLLRDPAAGFDRGLFWHYPHYHAGGDGPCSAILSGGYRLITFYEDQSVRLYHLADDPGERIDLSTRRPDIARRLRDKLQQWLDSVDAQLPTPNPNHDPAREAEAVRQKT